MLSSFATKEASVSNRHTESQYYAAILLNIYSCHQGSKLCSPVSRRLASREAWSESEPVNDCNDYWVFWVPRWLNETCTVVIVSRNTLCRLRRAVDAPVASLSLATRVGKYFVRSAATVLSVMRTTNDHGSMTRSWTWRSRLV